MTDPDRLIDRYLDATLSSDEMQQLERDLANPRYADRFALAMLIDALIHERYERDAITASLTRDDGSFMDGEELCGPGLMGDDDDLAAPTAARDRADLTRAIAGLAPPQDDDDGPLPEPYPPFSMTAELPGQRRRRIRRQKRLAAAAIAAAATIACTLLAVLIASRVQPTPQPPQTAQTHPEPGPAEPGRVGPEDPAPVPTPTRAQAVATLTNTHNATWGGAASAALKPGTKLHPNTRLTLTAGFAEITTARGAIAILQAPATIELTDHNNALRLVSGKLVGLCHTESSKGFVVHTDHADITDLGTEFGVDAKPDAVDTTVFDGEVMLTTRQGVAHPITRNKTARLHVESDGSTFVIENQPDEGYVRRMPRLALIADASINLPGFEVQVVPNAAYEDVKLFTDREHELNGIDAEGLPAFLLGGDLVRMPADARPDRELNTNDNNLRLEIETQQPTDLYILVLSARTEGDWLAEHYEPTGLVVGQDSVGLSGRVVQGENSDYPRGVGPGSSIDMDLEVWKRKQPADGRVFAGGPMKDSMYAVIAVPAAQSAPSQ